MDLIQTSSYVSLKKLNLDSRHVSSDRPHLGISGTLDIFGGDFLPNWGILKYPNLPVDTVAIFVDIVDIKMWIFLICFINRLNTLLLYLFYCYITCCLDK